MTKVRDLLTDRWLELRAEVEAAEQVQREATSAAANEVSDRKDEMAQRLPSDLGGAQEQRDVDEMAQVETALHRVEDGIYGDCTDCGEAIPPQCRLVQPAAQWCARCQAAYEHALKRPGSRRSS